MPQNGCLGQKVYAPESVLSLLGTRRTRQVDEVGELVVHHKLPDQDYVGKGHRFIH